MTKRKSIHEWRVEDLPGAALVKVYGPGHPDGGEYAPIFTTSARQLARNVVEKMNAPSQTEAHDVLKAVVNRVTAIDRASKKAERTDLDVVWGTLYDLRKLARRALKRLA